MPEVEEYQPEDAANIETQVSPATELERAKAVHDHNLGMLNVEMYKILEGESYGGNAGTIEIDGVRYVCAAANGYANAETGKIALFGNIQNVDASIRRDNVPFGLRLAKGNIKYTADGLSVESPWNRTNQIISIYDGDRLSPQGMEGLQAAVHAYNAQPEQKEYTAEELSKMV